MVRSGRFVETAFAGERVRALVPPPLPPDPPVDLTRLIGRPLVTLYLCDKDVLRKPLLYLKTHRADYYRLLQEVRERGAWEAWLEFFLDGVAETARQAFGAAERIVALFRRDRDRIGEGSDRAGSVLRVHEVFQRKLYATAAMLAADTKLSQPTVNAALTDLEGLGIVHEITGRRRGRVFAYRDYMTILDEGTAPLPA